MTTSVVSNDRPIADTDVSDVKPDSSPWSILGYELVEGSTSEADVLGRADVKAGLAEALEELEGIREQRRSA